MGQLVIGPVTPQYERTGGPGHHPGQRAHRQQQEFGITDGQSAGERIVALVDPFRAEQIGHTSLVAFGPGVTQHALDPGARHERQMAGTLTGDRQIDIADRLTDADMQGRQGVQMEQMTLHGVAILRKSESMDGSGQDRTRRGEPVARH